MTFRYIALAIFNFSLPNMLVSTPPAGFETVDRETTISTLVAQMKYDLPSFSVKPGEKVKIVFKNPDDLPHNLILCKPAKGNNNDKGKEVADAVLNLGEKGVEMNWVPKGHPRIIVHTDMVNPKGEETLYLEVPSQVGPYPYVCTFPGHAQMMNGVMIVAKNRSPIVDLKYDMFHGNWSKLPNWEELEANQTGALEDGFFNITKANKKDGFGFAFSGKLEITNSGTYEFFLTSDDGSDLRINDKLVVNNDGVHGNKRVSGKIKLESGVHAIKVGYFEKGGGESLYVGWKGPGFKEISLSKGGQKGSVKAPPESIPIAPLPGEAVIYRNFIDGAGPRAIGVGYAEGLNLAFDANQMRLAILWKGEFMDGGRHWTGRGQGFQPPAGVGTIFFPNGEALTKLESPSDPWPNAEERSSLVQFRGYHLNKKQHPTFRYSIGKAVFEDFFWPVKTEQGDWAFDRRIEIKRNGEDLTDYYLRVGIGAQDASSLPNSYLLGDTLTCSFKKGLVAFHVEKSGHPKSDGDVRIPLSSVPDIIHLTYFWL